MRRFLLALPALALLCLLIPQTAEASPSLDWDGKIEMLNGFQAPDILPNSADGDKVAKNIGHGAKAALFIGIGIPVCIFGGAMTGVAIYFFVAGDILVAAGDDGGALVSRIVGLVFLAIGISSLASGVSLIVKGVTAITKISDRSLTGPDPRMARAEKNRARWGMRLALGGVPLTR